MMKIYMKTIRDKKLRKIKRFKNGCWINLINPTLKELKKMKNELKIPSNFLISSLDEDERPRIEKKGDKTLVIIRVPYKHLVNGEPEVITVPLGIIILKDCILTVCKMENEIVKDFEKGRVKPFFTTQKGRFLLYIFKRTNYHYKKYLDEVEKRIRKTEVSIVKSLRNKEIMKLLMFQKTLVYFNAAIIANDKVFERIASGKVIKLHEKDQDLLEDLILDNREIMQSVKMFNEIMSNTLDAYTSIVSNNLNIVMKVLTSITIILSIPTILASFYGMNILLPLQQNPLAFWIIVLISLFISMMTFLFFRRMEWI